MTRWLNLYVNRWFFSEQNKFTKCWECVKDILPLLQYIFTFYQKWTFTFLDSGKNIFILLLLFGREKTINSRLNDVMILHIITNQRVLSLCVYWLNNMLTKIPFRMIRKRRKSYNSFWPLHKTKMGVLSTKHVIIFILKMY